MSGAEGHIVQFDNVGLRYGTEREVLSDVSFTLYPGSFYFLTGASGTITNIGSEARDVPPILIVMRDARERIVYSWEVQPPKRTLAPGESVTVNEAVTVVPRSAQLAEIGWKPEY